MVENDVNRRGFLKVLIGALNGLIALALAIPGLGYILTPIFRQESGEWVRLGPLSNFAPGRMHKAVFTYVSASGYTRQERENFVWLQRSDSLGGDNIAVFSPVCSHAGCNVGWNANESLFACPCHEGRYSVDGEVLSGPPPRPLSRLETRIENDELYIKFGV